MGDTKIRLCPCGAAPTVFNAGGAKPAWMVHCADCFEGVGPCETREAAIAEWNAAMPPHDGQPPVYAATPEARR